MEEVQAGLMKEAERFFLLTQIDNVWKDHLQSMQFLRQAVGLRGYGQRDPLTEYKLEGCDTCRCCCPLCRVYPCLRHAAHAGSSNACFSSQTAMRVICSKS